MLLPPPHAERQRMHLRRVEFQGFKRGDGLWEVEARLVDTKDQDFPLSSGLRRPGEAVHDISVRITFDERMNILDAATCIDAAPSLQRRYSGLFGLPVYATVKEAATQTGANVSVVYVPPPGAAAAIWEAVEADLDLVICITEGIPVRDMLEVRSRMRQKVAAGGKETLLLGPNCPGLITPDEIKIGIMPGHIHRKGSIGVVSRSGTLTYEAVAQLTAIGLGQSSAVGIGGDPINGLKHRDVMQLFNDDPETEAVIMIGEIGGPDEADAALWCKANMRKPVVGFIAGVTAPIGKRMGHAGALISGGGDTAEAKLAIMEECGFKITRNPSEMARVLKSLL